MEEKRHGDTFYAVLYKILNVCLNIKNPNSHSTFIYTVYKYGSIFLIISQAKTRAYISDI